MANLLSFETSPYLLQHAQNPVHWQAWNEHSLQRAKLENKPIILSIGYSACHWCHVMEHESFENEQIAGIMNASFVCIKVDREERPDVDNIYMDAVHAMGLHGGWPLNVFLTPDQKPFYGGTYFKPQQWAQICQSIAVAFVHQKNDVYKSAESFASHLNRSEIEKYGLDKTMPIDKQLLPQAIQNILLNIDEVWGGTNKAPKFPMPAIWKFLLAGHSAANIKDKNTKLADLLRLTLNKIAQGGIYDHIVGGFARYSVDAEWFCPHFEKMLYDNGQLLSLYAKAYWQFKEPLYKEVAEQTIYWLTTEMLKENGSFIAALDADSEGVEGKFYTWTFDEITTILQDKAEDFCKNYQITPSGNWEHGVNILWKNDSFLNANFTHALKKLEEVRKQKTRPGSDTKILTSWNALTITGLLDCYLSFGTKNYLNLAQNCLEFLLKNHRHQKKLVRCWNQQQPIIAFLDDYAAIIEALAKAYQCDFDENWLSWAETLTLETLDYFFDEQEAFFNYTQQNSELIAQKKEIFDNVIPASNSMMAHNLWDLGVLLGREDFCNIAKRMYCNIQKLITQNAEYTSNWGRLGLKITESKIEIVCTGPDALANGLQLKSKYQDLVYVLASESASNLILFEYRFTANKNQIFVCKDNICGLPLAYVGEVLV